MKKNRSDSGKNIQPKSEYNRTDDISFYDTFQKTLINRMMILWGIVCAFMIVYYIIRIVRVGFILRDSFLLSVSISFLILSLNNKKLSNAVKIFSLMSINTIVGIFGLYIFGATVGSVFFILIATIIMSLYSTKIKIIILVIILISSITAIAIGYISHQCNPLIDYHVQMDSYKYWITYIIAIASSLIITAVIIFRYRQSIWLLINTINSQRKELEKSNRELQESISKVKQLSGLLPICSRCKKIRDEKGYWKQLEEYLEKHSDASFSHSLCKDCADDLYGDESWYTGTEEK